MPSASSSTSFTPRSLGVEALPELARRGGGSVCKGGRPAIRVSPRMHIDDLKKCYPPLGFDSRMPGARAGRRGRNCALPASAVSFPGAAEDQECLIWPTACSPPNDSPSSWTHLNFTPTAAGLMSPATSPTWFGQTLAAFLFAAVRHSAQGPRQHGYRLWNRGRSFLSIKGMLARVRDRVYLESGSSGIDSCIRLCVRD